MEYLVAIFTVALVHFLAVVSPGPDFLMVIRNSLIYSRKTGIYTAIGLGIGILVHVAYSLVGIGFLIAQSVVLFNLIKYIGAGYLIYIGIKSLFAKKESLEISQESKNDDVTRWTAIKMGFMTNATNPKATLFFLSLFTLVINPDTPLSIKLIMGAEMAIVTAVWFMFVSFLVSHHLIKNKINRIQHFAEKFIGIVLIGLGIKVAFSQQK
jgi:RhtB (resistance to homoserine/threonine) family protein